MCLRPEDIEKWTVKEIPSVTRKAGKTFLKPEYRALESLYLDLKVKLETYPPDQEFFSIPRMDLTTNTFWVVTENNRIRIRAKYFAWAEVCIIDRFDLPEEDPENLEL